MWRSIRIKLVVFYLLLIVFALQLIGAYFVRTLTATLIRNATQTVESQTRLLATMAAPEMTTFSAHSADDVNSILSSLPQFVNGMVYFLNKDGVVEVTSAGPALVGQKRVDSVVTQAMVNHGRAVAIRYLPSTREHLLAVAVPMTNQSQLVGIVEYVVPIQSTYDTIHQVTTIFYTGSLLVLLLTTVLGAILSRTIAQPVLEVTQQARVMAGGDFTKRVAVRSHDEFGALAMAINDLANKLDEALAINLRERERLLAVIKYMGDGVIALDVSGQAMFTNDAAIRLLPNGAADIPMLTSILDLQLNRQHASAIRSGEQSFVRSLGPHLLHVHVTTMQRNKVLDGYVIVLRDVTEQERLDRTRKEFVENVSHELRTPLTSIKSYIEALRDGAPADEETRTKFLSVIAQQTERMVRLTQDLLQLSGLENRHVAETISDIDVQQWLAQAMERFVLQAERQRVTLTLEPVDAVFLQGDRDMLDRVLDNLLSNALKYTAAGGSVTVHTTATDDTVSVHVTDTGIGIAKEELPHVFERFYRVDKARSRRKGGTGLGLALVRDITEHYGGSIHITSEVNRGTTVTVSLPLTAEVTR